MIQLHLEVSSLCNATCHFCIYRSNANRQRRDRGFMDPSLFVKIIDDAATIPQIDNVAISGLGEMLLDRRLEDRIRYIKAKSSQWVTELYTNGAHLHPHRFDSLRDAGLDYLTVSLNAVRPSQHLLVTGMSGMFRIVERNIEYAIEHRGQVNVIVKAVGDGVLFQEKDAYAFEKRWGKWEMIPEDVSMRDVHGRVGGRVILQANWAGMGETILAPGFNNKVGCQRALGQIAVDRKGIVLQCCFDPLAKHPFGDLNRQTIREVYNSDAYVKFREAHIEDRADEYEACRVCTRI